MRFSVASGRYLIIDDTIVSENLLPQMFHGLFAPSPMMSETVFFCKKLCYIDTYTVHIYIYLYIYVQILRNGMGLGRAQSAKCRFIAHVWKSCEDGTPTSLI